MSTITSEAITNFEVPLEFNRTDFGVDVHLGLHSIRVYADRGTGVTFVGSLNSLGAVEGVLRAAVRGYLVECGPAPGCPAP
jgi:hypothetical protein